VRNARRTEGAEAACQPPSLGTASHFEQKDVDKDLAHQDPQQNLHAYAIGQRPNVLGFSEQGRRMVQDLQLLVNTLLVQ